MDNRKLLIFGFIVCILAALAYTFVFADLPFATPETPEAAAPASEATPATPAPETPAAPTP
jgi:hypothetical protein